MTYLIIWIVCGVIAGAINSNRGNSGIAGFIIGALLGPLGIILALVSKPNTTAIEQQQVSSGAMKKCPHCAELVRSDALVCRYCQRDLSSTPAGPPVARIQPNGTGGYVCNQCNGGVRPDAMSCKHCGVTFGQPVRSAPASSSYQHLRTPEPAPAAAPPYVKLTGTGRECSKCGEPVEKGAASCPACKAAFATSL